MFLILGISILEPSNGVGVFRDRVVGEKTRGKGQELGHGSPGVSGAGIIRPGPYHYRSWGHVDLRVMGMEALGPKGHLQRQGSCGSWGAMWA